MAEVIRGGIAAGLGMGWIPQCILTGKWVVAGYALKQRNRLIRIDAGSYGAQLARLQLDSDRTTIRPSPLPWKTS